MAAWQVAPAGSRRQAVRRRLDSISSKLLHRTILDFRLRLVLLAALTLPFILLGGCVHALASGQSWSTSVYLVYGLLFRVPALGAIRADEPAASALVLNSVFLFGVFGFAILLGLIGEEVKGTVKALRAGGTPLDLSGHVVLLNFTADATAVALLRQVAEDVGNVGSPLYGRPIVILASRPPPASSTLATGGSGGAEQSGGGGAGSDVEGRLKRVVADALQGRSRSCEWHLRVGSSCRTDDLARVCAATASYIVLLADPRVATSADATAAGAASCLQAQSLMCLSLALTTSTVHLPARQLGGGSGGSGLSWRGGSGGSGTGRGGGAKSNPVPSGGGGGGGGGGGAVSVNGAGPRGRQQVTIVVQSPADAPHSQQLPTAPPGVTAGGPIAVFRAVSAAEGCRPLVVEVCDRGIVDRLVAQTVLQPGVATVLARLFGGSGGHGTEAFRWVDWPGLPPAPAAAGGAAVAAAAFAAADATPLRGAAGSGGGGSSTFTTDLLVTGLRRRRLMTLPRTLSYNSSQRPLTAADAAVTAAASATTAGMAPSAESAATATSQPGGGAGCDGGCGGGCGGGGGCNSLSRCAYIDQARSRNNLVAVAAPDVHMLAGRTTADSAGVLATATSSPSSAAPSRLKPGALPAGANGCSNGRTAATFGEVRAAMEAAAAAATAAAAAGRSGWRRRQQAPASFPSPPSPSVAFSPSSSSHVSNSAGGSGGTSPLLSLARAWRCPPGSVPVVLGYKSGATGTLRLNPRVTSPVFPADKLVLLVSEAAPGSCGTAAAASDSRLRGPAGRSSSRDSSGSGGGGGGGTVSGDGGWWWLRRRRGGTGNAAPAAANASAAAAAAGGARNRTASTVGSKLLFSSSGTAAAAAAMLDGAVDQQGPPSPLQGWRSGPADQADNPVLALSTRRRPVGKCDGAVQPDVAAGTAPPVVPSPASDTAAVAYGMSDGGGGVRCSGCPPPRPLPRAPAAPPSHIIVISRTAAAVRGVVSGLQEFAPAGSTIALVVHEPCTEGVRQTGADVSAALAAASARPSTLGAGGPVSSGTSLPATSSISLAAAAAPVNAQATAAAASSSNGMTIVLPCPSSTWPVGESDLVVAGLAAATAILVARDSELQPQEADATALSAVLQLHQTLTDPTRSPLRRYQTAPPQPPAPQLQPLTRLVGGASAFATAALTASLTSKLDAMGAPLPHARVADEEPPLAPPRCLPAGAAATAAAAGAAGAPETAASPAPLHVVVCLHSTRSRDTLRAFLRGLNAQPPFTLEALVPEEYRALLLAGVVRQPQSHDIMTELLSDRPGSPEVYLVPPARLLAAAAAAAQELYGEGPPSVSGPGQEPAAALCTRALQPGPAAGDARDDGLAPRAQEDPGAMSASPHWSDLYSLRFCDVARAARMCGCTAFGVLRGGAGAAVDDSGAFDTVPLCSKGRCGGDGDGGDGGLLELAPNPEAPLQLSPGDRLVVLAADPV